MSENKRNVDLFDRIADQIEKHPETYYQGWWSKRTSCGTAFCIAGHAAKLMRCKSRARDDWEVVVPPDGDGDLVEVDVYAKEKLGLTSDEADILFEGDWRPPKGETVPPSPAPHRPRWCDLSPPNRDRLAAALRGRLLLPAARRHAELMQRIDRREPVRAIHDDPARLGLGFCILAAVLLFGGMFLSLALQ